MDNFESGLAIKSGHRLIKEKKVSGFVASSGMVELRWNISLGVCYQQI